LALGRVAIWGSPLFSLRAGAMLPIQFGINAQLATWLGSSGRAALVSFVVGAPPLGLGPLAGARDWAAVDRGSGAPWWVWVGGILGAFYVLGSIVAAPRLGAVTLF